MKKTYVLDTNVLLSDPNALFAFKENDIVLPLVVLEELDRHKDRHDDAGHAARETTRKLALILKDHKDFKTGAQLPEDGTLRIMSLRDFGCADLTMLPSELRENSGDNSIIALCSAYKQTYPNELLVLVTRDILLRLKAASVGIVCEDFKRLSVAASITGLYTGCKTVTVSDVELDQLYSVGNGYVPPTLVELLKTGVLYANQFLVLKSDASQKSAIRRLVLTNSGQHVLKSVSEDLVVSKIQPKNKEQRFAFDLLLDQSVGFVTLAGKSGTGKTLIAIASGMHQVLEQKRYKSLVVCRPVQTVGKDLGYLPGSLEEKLMPWVEPIKDNLRFLLSENGKKNKIGETSLNMLFDDGTIEVEAMAFIRGRSIANAFMIVDEAQNISPHELKTIITRVGEGTKLVLTGDIEQIDSMYLDSLSNGLTVAIERFKEYPIAGHVTLYKGERSQLATLASNIL